MQRLRGEGAKTVRRRSDKEREGGREEAERRERVRDGLRETDTERREGIGRGRGG